MSVSNVPGYGRIRRGSMAADAFTQIRNALFRDPRISFKAKGVFGLISTHRDGYGVTPESIAAAGRDGVSAVKGALRELEEYGYLIRARERRADGTLGGSHYYITDMPDHAERGSCRSAPEVENPLVVRPPVAEPTVVDRLHKKTNSKKTSGKNALSRSGTRQPAAAPARQAERDRGCAGKPTNTAQRIIREVGVVTTEEEAAFIAWAEAKHRVQGGGWWRSVAANGDLPGLVAAWRAGSAPRATQRPSLPAWCGDCGDGMPAAQYNSRFRRDADGQPCPACHPDRAGQVA